MRHEVNNLESSVVDKADHQRLIRKLLRIGIHPQVVYWIQSFLNERTQKTIVSGEESSEYRVQSGVPQRSVLGHCLFLIYINDLPLSVQSSVRLFADDTIVYLIININSECGE